VHPFPRTAAVLAAAIRFCGMFRTLFALPLGRMVKIVAGRLKVRDQAAGFSRQKALAVQINRR
jgi:hypothetical protein